MWHCLYCASDNSCVDYAVCSYNADTMCFEAICALWKGKRMLWFTQSVYEIIHRKFQITWYVN